MNLGQQGLIPIFKLPFARIEVYLSPANAIQLPTGRHIQVAIEIMPGRLTLVIAKVKEEDCMKS